MELSVPEELRVELYWSFRSPYSYLALPRVKRLAAEYPVEWDVRIVYPLAGDPHAGAFSGK